MTELKPNKFENVSKTSIFTEQQSLGNKKQKLETKLEPVCDSKTSILTEQQTLEDQKPKLETKSEPVQIGVVIKSESEVDDKKAFITLIKRENKPDLFNLDAIGLGPPVVVRDERAQTGWTRKEIGDVC